MKARSLPQFINKDHMVFVTDFSPDEWCNLILMKETGQVERIESLGKGEVVWFSDRRDTLKFLLKHG